jgi:hypothetical protein
MACSLARRTNRETDREDRGPPADRRPGALLVNYDQKMQSENLWTASVCGQSVNNNAELLLSVAVAEPTCFPQQQLFIRGVYNVR